MKNFFIATAMALAMPLLSFAQEKDNFTEDMKHWKYGDYEIKLSNKNYSFSWYKGNIAGIMNSATGKWVAEPVAKKKEGRFWFQRFEIAENGENPHSYSCNIRFLTKDSVNPVFDGLVEINSAQLWDKGIDYPAKAWYLLLQGIFRIENDELVPIVRSSKSISDMERNGEYYGNISTLGTYPFINGIYQNENGTFLYHIFNPQGEKLFDAKDIGREGENIVFTLMDGRRLFFDENGKEFNPSE